MNRRGRVAIFACFAVLLFPRGDARTGTAWMPIRAARPSGSTLFVPNVGQFDSGTRFQARWGGTTLWLADDAVWVTVVQARDPGGSGLRPGRDEARGARGVHLKLTLPDMAPNAHLVAADSGPGTASYFLGKDPARWRAGVPMYAIVRWEGVRPGVGLAFRSAADGVSITVERAAGARPEPLRLRVDGEAGLRLDSAGRLVAETEIGVVTLPELLDRDGSRLRARVSGKEILFDPAGSQEPDQRPAEPAPAASPLMFSTYLGAQQDDDALAVAVGPDGAAYVTGVTNSPRFPTTPGVFDPTYNSQTPGFAGDVFVVKLDPTHSQLIYSTFLGGFDTDYGTALAVGPNGEAYVAGYTFSDDFPTTPGTWSPSFMGGCCDVFVAKLDPGGGALVFSTFLGGTSIEDASALALGPDGKIYVTGQTSSLDFPTTAGAYDRTYESPSYSEAYVTVLSPRGRRLVYSTFLGGSYNDYGEGIALGTDGSAYVAGRTMSFDFPTTPGAYDRSFNGGSGDAFVARLNALGGDLVFSTYVGGIDDESANGLVVDGSGRALVTGSTVSPNFPTTPDGFQRSCASCASFAGDAFVNQLDASGQDLVYGSFLGGADTDLATGIALGDGRSVYLVGTTYSTDFPTSPDALDPTLGGSSDAFVAKVDTRGGPLDYGTFLGGSGLPGGFSYDWGAALAVQDEETVLIVGSTGAADFPITEDAPDRRYSGENDAFLTKLLPQGPPLALDEDGRRGPP
jgi:hypothetical protein